METSKMTLEGFFLADYERMRERITELEGEVKRLTPDGYGCIDQHKTCDAVKCEFPRRQAMLSIREPHYKGNGIIEYDEVARVPVFVWPMPTSEGLFVVEHQDGTVQRVQPDSLTFLGSKELFDQYDWKDDA